MINKQGFAAAVCLAGIASTLAAIITSAASFRWLEMCCVSEAGVTASEASLPQVVLSQVEFGDVSVRGSCGWCERIGVMLRHESCCYFSSLLCAA